MLLNFTRSCLRPLAVSAGFVVILMATPGSLGQEQSQLSEPVYRVANETTPAQPVAVPVASQPAAAPTSPFDLTQQAGEHPLAPFVRVCKESLHSVEQNVRDYSCTLVKRERVDGDLGEPQHIFMKVRHEPFSVYMRFVRPFPGREVLYVDGQNNNEMFVLEAGWKRSVLGKMSFHPENAVVMRGQKYPVTRVGIRNLLAQLIKYNEADMQYAECEMTSNPEIKIAGRSTTMVQITHPIPRQNFRSHIARVFFDNELRVPIHYDSYLWPEQQNQQPPLEESYTYTNLKLNNGFTARDFDSENPEIFRP
jgi:hypothetical protein